MNNKLLDLDKNFSKPFPLPSNFLVILKINFVIGTTINLSIIEIQILKTY